MSEINKDNYLQKLFIGEAKPALERHSGGGGASVKLGELTVSTNGEYEAKTYGALEGSKYVIDANTTPDITSTDVDMIAWKIANVVPADFEEFKKISSSIVEVPGYGSMTTPFSDGYWQSVSGIVEIGSLNENFVQIFVIYDPVALKGMGLPVDFEQGVYACFVLSEFEPIATAGAKITITSQTSVPCDGYSKVTVEVPTPSNGGLNWIATPNGTQYAIQDTCCVIAGNPKIEGNLLASNANIKRVFIMDGITNIGDSAFNGCTGLTDIDIPDGVTRIGGNVFQKCTGLTSIHIPDSVTEIGGYAFGGCTGLTSIDIPDGVTSIGEGAFGSCSKLSSVNIPDGITSISESTFLNCTALTSIDIPDSVTEIGNAALRGCSNLTDINYTGTVEQWNAITFGTNWNYSTGLYVIRCTDGGVTKNGGIFRYSTIPGEEYLGFVENDDGTYSAMAWDTINVPSEVTIPDNYNGVAVTAVYEKAFYTCTGLTSVDIPDSVTSIGEYAFYKCTGLTSVVIPESITSIGEYAFGGCTALTSIDIPDSVTSIGEYAFGGCTALTSIDIPDSVTSIGDRAFYKCTSLTSVNIPDGITSIGNSVFDECTSLTSIDIPDSVTSIGRYTFYNCSNITSVVIPDNVTSIGDNAFKRCGLKSVTFGETSQLKTIGESAFWGCDFTSIDIPDSVTSIGDSAFSSCSYLTSIVIPDGVTKIRYETFYQCSKLSSVYIPSSVTSMGVDAFRECPQLTDITYIGTIEQWKAMTLNISWNWGTTNYTAYCLDGYTGKQGHGTYYTRATSAGVDGTIIYKGANIDKIPNDTLIIYSPDISGATIVEIGGGAFRDCYDLTGIVIPDSVVSINDSAFYGCSKLTSITYEGTIEQWNAITFGTDWNYGTGEYTIHCTDGDIAKDGTVTYHSAT